MRVKFLAPAERELLRAKAWYLERSPQAAAGFDDEIGAAIDRIVSQPSLFAVIHRDRRSCPVRRYPYRIIFQAIASEITIVAIVHDRRKPGYWRRRQ